MNPKTLDCYLVSKSPAGDVHTDVIQRPLSDLPEGDVLIRVEYSSLNYKDGLAATGHPGVVRKFPHVPGIDAAGSVAESRSADVSVGGRVLVTGYELGSGQWGGWAEYVRVPAEWVVLLPEGLSLKEAMIFGTAGFTAARCVMALEHHSIFPDSGDVVVTGASGGVGSLAVRLLSRLGYTVVAVTGKTSAHGQLERWGAAQIIGRDEVDYRGDRPLLSARWAGAVDTVGGNILPTLLRATQNRGCVTACGLVAGAELPTTVHPFILRGVTLVGIDSAHSPSDERLAIWQKLAGPWKLDNLAAMTTEIDLTQLTEHVRKILAGQITGRVVVRPTGSS